MWTHCRHMKERGQTPAVYFQGRLVPWTQAWKEIRRNVPEHTRSAAQGKSQSKAWSTALHLGINALLTITHSASHFAAASGRCRQIDQLGSVPVTFTGGDSDRAPGCCFPAACKIWSLFSSQAQREPEHIVAGTTESPRKPRRCAASYGAPSTIARAQYLSCAMAGCRHHDCHKVAHQCRLYSPRNSDVCTVRSMGLLEGDQPHEPPVAPSPWCDEQ